MKKSITSTVFAISAVCVAALGCSAAGAGGEPGSAGMEEELPSEDDFVSGGGKADFGSPDDDAMRRWRNLNDARWEDDAHCAVDPECDVRRPIADVKNGKRVLVVITGAEEFKVYDKKAEAFTTFPTGYFVRELVDVLEAMLEDGYEVDFATSDGQLPRVDENGQTARWFALPNRFALKAQRRADVARAFVEGAILERGVISLEQAVERLDEYDGMVAPGGHGPMFDFPESAALGTILRHMHDARKPTGLICHAPVALLATRDKTPVSQDGWEGWDYAPDPDWIYAGYRVATATKAEENLVRWFSYLPNELHVTYYVDQELEEAGVELVKHPVPSFAKAIRDGELITGQNPWSSHYFGEGFVEALAETP
jgi:putative intracellular protease/amidase